MYLNGNSGCMKMNSSRPFYCYFVVKLFDGRPPPENYLDQKQLAWKGRRLTTLGDQT